MPVTTITRFRLAAGVAWFGNGAALAAGPPAWRSSPSYDVIKTLAPLRIWGVLFVCVGLAELVAHSHHHLSLLHWACIAGAMFAAAWAVSFLAGALIGHLTGAGGPFLYGYLAATQAAAAGAPILRRRRR